MPDLEDTPIPGLETGSRAPNLRDAPEMISKYEIRSLLGEGGMGKVYRAWDPLLQREVAIKVLPREDVETGHIQRFQQEAKAASKLTHPGLIMAIDFGVTETQEPYLVMEYVEGQPFDQVLKNRGPLELDEFFTVFSQILEALEHAHNHRVIHRDIKPSNIMIKESDGIKQAMILDFGIAKVLDSGVEQFKTKTGHIVGSPLYISPEQINGEEVDVRADIYALGCVMFEALTGTPPFKGSTALSTYQMHIEGKIPKVSSFIHGGEFEELDSFFEKIMAKSKTDRFQSMPELIAALNVVSNRNNELEEETRRESSFENDAKAVSSSLDLSVESFRIGFSGALEKILRQLFSKKGGIISAIVMFLLACNYVYLLNRPKDSSNQTYKMKDTEQQSLDRKIARNAMFDEIETLNVLQESVRSDGKWFTYSKIFGDDGHFSDAISRRPDIKRLTVLGKGIDFRGPGLASLPPGLERLEIKETDFHSGYLKFLPKLKMLKGLLVKGHNEFNHEDFSYLNNEKLPGLEELVLDKVNMQDKDLSLLLSLKKLRSLAILNNLKFTGSSLAHLKDFPDLSILSLYRCDNLKLQNLRVLNQTNVKSLNLARVTSVSDKDIDILSKLKLERLEVVRTNITPSGGRKLKKLMPNTVVVY